MRILVLISGRGSNLEALLKHQQNYTVTHVVSNNFKARGIDIAVKYGINNTCIDWSNTISAENILIDVIEESQADLIVLAGFMRILSKHAVQFFHNKIINIHPSLLPKYPGLNTHRKVIENNDPKHGASVHLVDNLLDHGRVLAQTQFKVEPNDDAEALAKQLISKEHKLLTSVMSLIGSAKLTWDDEHIFMNDKKITKPLMVE